MMRRWIAWSLLSLGLFSAGCAARGRYYRDDYRYHRRDRDWDHDRDHDRDDFRR